MNASTARWSGGGMVSFRGVDTAVECAAGETILLAGLRAGLSLPYECASGGCGTCRARLLDGRVITRWPEATGLSERDRKRGDRILLCQSLPDGPCQVRANPLPDGRPEPAPRRLAARLTEREPLTAETSRFVVDARVPFDYLPGQYVLLEFADGVRRAYSMTRPQGGDAIELLVRAKPGGQATSWLFERLEVGAELVVEGPYGRAYAQSPADRPVVGLAGGTGLAPVLAIVQQLVAEAPGRPVHFFVGARRPEELVFTERLAALKGSGVNVVAAVDEGGDDGGGSHRHLDEVRTGLVLDHLADELPDLAGHDVYLAGPAPMIDAALRRLVREGTASADRIFFDRFFA